MTTRPGGDEIPELPRRFPRTLGLAVAGILASALGWWIAPDSPYSVVPGLLLTVFAAVGRLPYAAFYAIVFLFPFGAFRGNIHWIIAVCLTAALFWHFAKQRTLPRSLKSNLWVWWGSYMAASFIAACFSPFREEAFESWILQLAGGVFVAVCMIVISPRGFRKTLPAVIVLSITIGSSLSVAGYLFDLSLFAVKVDQFKRGFGGTVSPNSLAILIVSVIPFLVYYLLQIKRTLFRVLLVAAVSINLAAIVTTYSRGGFWILVLISAATLFEFRHEFRVRHAVAVGAWIGLYLVFTTAMVPSSEWRTEKTSNRPGKKREQPSESYYWERQKSLSDTDDFSINRRLAYLLVGWEAFKKRPLLGSGPMTFKHIYRESPYAENLRRKSERKTGQLSSRVAHNTYLEVLVGSGIVGLAFFLGLLGRALLNFTRAQKAFFVQGDRSTGLLCSAYRLSFLSILVYFCIQSMVYHKPFLLLLAVSQAALVFAGDNAADQKVKPVF